MNQGSKVSVLIATFNSGPYLEPALRSICSQTYTNLEIVVVDDGSTDGSAHRVKALIADPRICWVHQNNSGLAAALNEGIRHCTGRYIARMDSDDISLPKRIARQVATMDANPEVGLLGTQVARVDDKGQRISDSAFPCEHDEIVQALRSGTHALAHPTVMIRRSVLASVGGYWRHGVAEDWDLYLRIGEKAKLANLPQVYLRYRFHGGGINSTSMKQVRVNIAYAVYLHRCRANDQQAMFSGPDEFFTRQSRWTRLKIYRESLALKYYRRYIAARQRPFRAVFFAGVSIVVWPEQALRRLSSRIKGSL